jgi:hypothetical protein
MRRALSKIRTAACVSVLLGLVLTVVGCGSGAAELEALGDKIGAETDALLAEFESVKDEATATSALPGLIESYDRLVANAKELEATAKRNLGRGLTAELQEKLKVQQEAFSKRFQTHRKKLSKNLKVMQVLEPLFKKMESEPMQ